MTEKELQTEASLMLLMNDIPTWTKTRRGILKRVLHYMKSGTHEYFTSNPGIHRGYELTPNTITTGKP